MSQVVVSQLLPNSLSKLRRRFTRARSQEATEARDLVDLQLLWQTDEASLVLIAQTTSRLFSFRRTHAFPGHCTATAGWDIAYTSAAVGLPVRSTVDEAADWLNVRLAELASRSDS